MKWYNMESMRSKKQQYIILIRSKESEKSGTEVRKRARETVRKYNYDEGGTITRGDIYKDQSSGPSLPQWPPSAWPWPSPAHCR